MFFGRTRPFWISTVGNVGLRCGSFEFDPGLDIVLALSEHVFVRLLDSVIRVRVASHNMSSRSVFCACEYPGQRIILDNAVFES